MRSTLRAIMAHWHTLVPLLVAVISTAASAGDLAPITAGGSRPEAGRTQVARYSTLTAAPDATEDNPMAVIAVVHFPRAAVATVGDAVRHLLLRTGYSLAADEALDPSARRVLGLPLPESHRKLGPYRVDAMLSVLLGQPWTVNFDPINRVVLFSAPGSATSPARTADASTASPAPTTAATAIVARPGNSTVTE